MFRLRQRHDEHAKTGEPVAEGDYYASVYVGAEAIGELACEPETFDQAYGELERLEVDDYVAYVRSFVDEGRRRLGPGWRYADIVTVLSAAATLLEPSAYLEIGVRRGRSLAIVAARTPHAALFGVDLWLPGYAGIENPGPEFVRKEIAKTPFEGSLELLSGDSHELLPQLFVERPDLSFDLITVDGDHSTSGAEADLRAVLPRLRIGGALVFDDVRHPAHPELFDVWESVVARDRRYTTWSFADVGYGVAIAVRRW